MSFWSRGAAERASGFIIMVLGDDSSKTFKVFGAFAGALYPLQH